LPPGKRLQNRAGKAGNHSIGHAAEKIDAFVLNELILKYLVKKEFPGRVRVIPEIFDEYFVVMALKEKSSLRKPINIALLKFMKTEKWSELLNHYAH
jgi:ABC-type amino acid transport substrate-binding protein